jgi:hypothetical protein
VQQLTSPVLQVASQVKYSLLLLMLSIFVVASCTQLSENAVPDLSKEQLYGKLRSVTTTYHSNQSDTRQKDDQIISKVEFSETGEILLAETYMDYPYDYDEPKRIDIISLPRKEKVLHLLDGLELEEATYSVLYGGEWPALLAEAASTSNHPIQKSYTQKLDLTIDRTSQGLPEEIRFFETQKELYFSWTVDIKHKFEYDEQGRVKNFRDVQKRMHMNENDKDYLYLEETEITTSFDYNSRDQIASVMGDRNAFHFKYSATGLKETTKQLNGETVNSRKYFYDKNGLKTKTEIYNRYGDLEYTVLYEYDFFE